ncbi:MAG: GlsB/YeaQ/YmgE family stress response membrane protein [Rhodospirillales bacterium]|nr:GlsB/YeaQ/YmgE family stress response membrane protein [Rhodospirillales bacterium]
MHWVNVAIILCVGNFVAWMAAMYVSNAVSGLLGHLVVSTIGAFIGGYLTLEIIPKYGTAGMIPGALVGSILLLYFVRFKKWRLRKKTPEISNAP